jgi:hypothetical protein
MLVCVIMCLSPLSLLSPRLLLYQFDGMCWNKDLQCTLKQMHIFV